MATAAAQRRWRERKRLGLAGSGPGPDEVTVRAKRYYAAKTEQALEAVLKRVTGLHAHGATNDEWRTGMKAAVFDLLEEVKGW